SLLIFEPEANGHPREWLEHIATHLRRMEPQPSGVFAVVHALAAGLEAEPVRPAARIFLVIKLAPTQPALCRHRNLAVSGFARWRTMRNYLALTRAETGFFMGLDHLTLPLALGFGRRGPALAGILFRPSVHYRSISNYRPSLMERVRDIRK